ncbi:MAG: hypothetical protein HY671_04355 [Chloroflexi bacterium]|nr:hypothetical protein [Chloroflexota bacterium]
MEENLPVPKNPGPLANRTIEVARTYLHRGGTATHTIWVSVGPRRPWLKVLMAPLLVAATLSMVLLLTLVMAFALLSVALIGSLSKLRRSKSVG